MRNSKSNEETAISQKWCFQSQVLICFIGGIDWRLVIELAKEETVETLRAALQHSKPNAALKKQADGYFSNTPNLL